jgi:hypothetical protein
VKISPKGVLIGAMVDVGMSFLLGVPLVIYAMSKIDLTHTPKDQIGSTITTSIHGNPSLYAAQLLIGFGCSVLARIIHIFEDNKSLLCYKHVV